MWLQRNVPGRRATDLLAGPAGVALARKIAEAACKVHRAGIAAPRRHTMADELRILHECLPTVARLESRRAGRIERILDASTRLGAATPDPAICGLNPDFYGNQATVDG